VLFFTVAGLVVVLIAAIVFIVRQSRGEDYPSEIKTFDKRKNLNSHNNASYEKMKLKGILYLDKIIHNPR
jgi:hypothetical protein